MSSENAAWIFASRPNPEITVDCLRVETIPTPSADELKDDEYIVQLTFISVDPYMRPRMNENNYFTPLLIGDVMSGGCSGVVLHSKNPNFQVGDKVTGFLHWKKIQVCNSSTGLTKFSAPFSESKAVGTLGMPGATAYFSALEIGKPVAGDVVFVSGAAGAVGAIVGQIFKLKGCTVIGSAGSDDKVAYLKEIGFDHAFNYKTIDLDAALTKFAPDGIDIYYDNIGGEFLDISLKHVRTHGRVVACGSISQYNTKPENVYGVKNLFVIVTKSIRLEGFLVNNWLDRFPEGLQQLQQWLVEGKIKDRETIVEGFDNVPKAFVGLFTGDNTGKMVVKV